MPYDIKKTDMPHNVILEGRERLSISGVEDVESFDEESIVAYTSAGTLIIRGNGLHIEKLSLDLGELTVDGYVDSLGYESEERKVGLWQRLFK